MEDIKSLITTVLEKGYLMSLATVDEGGPWVSDVIYVHDEKWNLFWISETETRHSQAIEKNRRVAATVTVSNNPGEDNVGLQIEGVAEKIEGDSPELSRAHREKRKKPIPEEGSGILEEGESWYVLKPTNVELIYEPLFGFDKKTVKI